MASVVTKQRPDRATGKTRTVYVTRWRDPSGKHREATFARKADATDHALKVENDKRTGAYTDPKAGRVTFKACADRWLATKKSARKGSTATSYELHLTKHILPKFGRMPIASVRPSDVQAWANERSTHLAPSTLHTVYGHVAAIFREAVRDRLIAHTPCDRIDLPDKVPTKVSPLTPGQVHALAEGINPRYRALVITGAGTGLRLSELFGLTVDRVDFLGHNRRITVDRQLGPDGSNITADGLPVFTSPKTPASVRTVPLPQVVADTLAAHLAQYRPGPGGLLFTNTGRGAPGAKSAAGRVIRKNGFYEAWARGIVKANEAIAEANELRSKDEQLPLLPTHTTPHDLRHSYASLLIAANESPR